MNILSKALPVEESIARMSNSLALLDLDLMFSEEKHPLGSCYSVNLSARSCPGYLYTNGKGSHSLASQASAMGEYVERLQTNNLFSDFYLPEMGHYPDEVVCQEIVECLSPELLSFYDADGELANEHLVDFNSDSEGIVALPFRRIDTGGICYFPQNLLANLYASNGMATGNTPAEARVQALSEIVERYVKFEVIRSGYALPSYPPEAIARIRSVREDIATLRENGYIVDVLDASLGGRFPVTAISLINPRNGTLFVSFGAHPIFEVAVSRTMTELMQGRGMDGLDGFEMPTFDRDAVADSFNLESHFIDSNGRLSFDFLKRTKDFVLSAWGYTGSTTEQEWDYLAGIVAGLGKTVYLREYNFLGFDSCHIVVPSFSEVYPVEDLIYNNKNSGKMIRHLVLNHRDYAPQEILDAVDDLSDALGVEKYIGVIFRNDFTIGDLKAHAYLKMGDYESAADLLRFRPSRTAAIVTELIMLTAQGWDVEEYRAGMEAVYTAEGLAWGLAVLAGEADLIDTALAPEYEAVLHLYRQLDTLKRTAYGTES